MTELALAAHAYALRHDENNEELSFCPDIAGLPPRTISTNAATSPEIAR
jgi:hypothetical protein